MALKKDFSRKGWSRPRKTQFTESLRKVDQLILEMRRDQVEIERLKTETRALLTKLNVA
jgi:hypothetical protein